MALRFKAVWVDNVTSPMTLGGLVFTILMGVALAGNADVELTQQGSLKSRLLYVSRRNVYTILILTSVWAAHFWWPCAH